MTYCVFLDIDGTLLDHEVGIQESSIKAIHKAQENGHKICIATGRPRQEIDDELHKIPFDAYIYSCGAFVETPSEILFYEPLTTPVVNEVIHILQQEHTGFNLEGIHASYLDTIGYAYFQQIFGGMSSSNSELTRQFMSHIRMFPYHTMREEDKEQIVKLATFAPNMTACERIQKRLPSSLNFMIHGREKDSLINGEILPNHISKATGIDCLCNHFHIPLDHCIAIGDSLNDLPMIQHCGIGIAMGNATEKLKQASTFITSSSKEDGIYHAFKKLNLI